MGCSLWSCGINLLLCTYVFPSSCTFTLLTVSSGLSLVTNFGYDHTLPWLHCSKFPWWGPCFQGKRNHSYNHYHTNAYLFTPISTAFHLLSKILPRDFQLLWPLLKVETTFQTIWSQIPKAVAAFTLLLFLCFQMLWKRFCVIHQIHWIWMSFSCLLSLEMRANSQTFGYRFSIFGQGYSTIPSLALWVLARYHLPHFVIPNLLAFYWSSAWLCFMD